jgi:hypothetical protein
VDTSFIRQQRFSDTTAPTLCTNATSDHPVLNVNTKNWYTKGIDLWAEIGNEIPFDKKISSEDSVKMLAVGRTPSFGRKAFLCLKEEVFGNT